MFGTFFCSLLTISVASVAAKDAVSIYSRLGNLSPYAKGPVPEGVKETLPADCKVDQVMFVCTSACAHSLAHTAEQDGTPRFAVAPLV